MFETIVNGWTTPDTADPNVSVHLVAAAAEAGDSTSHLGGLAESGMAPSGPRRAGGGLLARRLSTRITLDQDGARA